MTGKPVSLMPDRIEKVIGVLALVLLGFVVTAVAKGSADWGKLPWELWLHLATMALTLALTPAILWMRRGTLRHRVAGYAWVTALAVTALVSFRLRFTNHGGFSVIHLLSVITLVLLPALVLAARRHNHALHKRLVRGLCLGALLTAGFFTFPFHRLLGRWLFG
ncbi:DUF2306 domain-containing protein [Novosphingobium album (ex Liu et al. 2023)]|uniref:DUF2306 domain-containing protein n=1 Tax=Novosphingobium album (ex Liu et al. 2023) TaxID=3031130 RepID=A0ABT5WKZ7_9SPHN|nr:hypothetical protein [Novosphingobium album (ex Liu et al. 2023)]MDE8650719.1 hypothetical protein [Novosphingobium album (ex Liu et al. 2023)]